jgi:hypothetical protein
VPGMATVIVEHLLRTLPPAAGERLLDGLEAPEAGLRVAQPAAVAAEAGAASDQRSHIRAARATDSSTSSSSM